MSRERSASAVWFLRRSVVAAAALAVVAACEPSTPPVAPSQPPAPPPDVTQPDAGAEPADASAQSPDDAGATTRLFVAPKLVDCEGEGPMKCMQVRASETEEWTLLYGSIQGFSFEEGYAYELRVRAEPVARPPMGASSKRLHLVEVVSKKPAPR